MPGEDEILDNSAVDIPEDEDTAVDQGQDEEVEASEPKVKMVDKRALDETRAEKRALREELARVREQYELTRLQAMRLQEEYSRIQGGYGQQNFAGLDPEIQKNLEPYLAPFKRDLEQAKQLLYLQAQKAEADEAIRTLEREFPEIDEYREDIAEFLEDMDDQERNRILSSPKALAKIGRMIQRQKGGNAERTAKKIVNQRAKSESGQSNNRTVPKSEWQDMKPGSKEFGEYLRQRLGWTDN